MITVHGAADDGFGPVADAFRENFTEDIEVGAACAVYHRGRLVVDLYAGVADARTNRPWGPQTLAVVFSVGKGLMTLCAYLAHQRGLLDFDAPVVSVWPEFGANGKEQTTIRDLFCHRAGLAALDTDLTLDDLAEWTPVNRAIEEQKPLWQPGTDFAYHALTFGWLTGEVLRRVTGLSPHDLLAEYLTTPLGADAWIGLPTEEEPRVAFHLPRPQVDDPAYEQFVQLAMGLPAVIRALSLGGALAPTLIDGSDRDFNAPAVHALQIPAANAITSAASLARIYAAAVSSVDGRPPLLSAESVADATTLRSSGPGWPGALTRPGIRFGTGFMINGIPYLPLLSGSSFGHDGASGSLGFADADAEIGFGYVNNRFAGSEDGRASRLTPAVRRSLGQ